VLQQVQQLMLQALRVAPPPASWLERWFSLMEADPWGLWSEAEVLEAAGPALQARYAERAAQDWQRWLAAHPAEPAAHANGKAARPDRFGRTDWERHRIRARYLGSLQRQGDVQAVIDAMRAHLASSAEHSQLIAYCELEGRYREAMQYAQAARRQYPDDWRIELDLLRCYERDGWDEEALAIRRRLFERQPDVEHYRAVLAAAQRAGQDQQRYREQLFEWARQQEQTQSSRNGFSGYRGRKAGERNDGTDVSIRVSWLLADGQFEDALTLVTGHRCKPRLLLEIARWLPPERNAEAAPLLQRVFKLSMQDAKSPYREPLALVKETLARMTPQQGLEWNALLRAQYKAKRNFIAGLP
jgi:hypothetical protein